MTARPSMPVKSSGLHVYTGGPFARAVAAIIASYARAAGLRHGATERCSHPAKGAGRRRIERQRIEVGLGLLNLCLAGGAFEIGGGH
jgi:hypothetical protein